VLVNVEWVDTDQFRESQRESVQPELDRTFVGAPN